MESRHPQPARGSALLHPLTERASMQHLPVPAGEGAPHSHSPLSAAGVTALRSALQACHRDGALDDHLVRAMKLLCVDAHRGGVEAEKLVIAVKEAWASLPEIQNVSHEPDRDALRDRVITLCIREYYAADAGRA